LLDLIDPSGHNKNIGMSTDQVKKEKEYIDQLVADYSDRENEI